MQKNPLPSYKKGSFREFLPGCQVKKHGDYKVWHEKSKNFFSEAADRYSAHGAIGANR
jgi:hypothetical protein